MASERAPEWVLKGARRTRARVRETLSGKALVPRRTMPFGTEPLSYLWGNDRGTALHRHYLDRWLVQQGRRGARPGARVPEHGAPARLS
jgi:hypothetical protein